MICPKCHTAIDVPTQFCPACGVSLQRSGGRILAITAGLVLVIVIGVYSYVNHRFFERQETRSIPASKQTPGTTSTRPTDIARVADSPASPALIQSQPITTGTLVLRDITGQELGSYTVSITPSGWFAFPRRLCMGAYTWQVELDSGRPLPVEGGLLQDEDPVGLWQVPAAAGVKGLELAPWTRAQPLNWHVLDNDQPGQIVSVRTVERFARFDRIPMDGKTDSPGYFVQDNHLVGWSFGEGSPGGYLWTGNQGPELNPEFYTDDFYRLTFEGGREEALLLAISDESLSDLQRLTALAEAYRLDPRMPQSALPEYIAPATIHATMRSLVQSLRAQGRTEDLLGLFDPGTLSIIAYPPLAMDLVTAAQDAGEYADALTLIEAIEEATPGDAGQRKAFETTQTAIYGDWLNRLIAEGDDETARAIYAEANDRFPQDPAIHLAGVELMLRRQDWALAERLLAALDYPPGLRDRVSRLQRAISDMKSQEGKIVIRFQPGARMVPVMAGLGEVAAQRFLIDTGASLVTVPAETVRRLGIDLSGSLPRRLFYSATGVQNAVEVTLPIIEIDGWVVKDIKALVVDLPGQPGIGLLGMNYLRNFRMDLNTEAGLLTLAPR